MRLIFQIAAGVIIGLLLVNIFFAKSYEHQMSGSKSSFAHSNKLASGANMTVNTVKRYLKKNNKLPRFVSDISCHGRGYACPTIGEDGAFYLVSGEAWVKLEFKERNGKLVTDCSVTSKELSTSLQFGSFCKLVSNKEAPALVHPRIPCERANRLHEKKICRSDRLVAADWAVEKVYQEVLAGSLESRKVRLIAAQKQKLSTELSRCKTDECIEKSLWLRYAELQQL